MSGFFGLRVAACVDSGGGRGGGLTEEGGAGVYVCVRERQMSGRS